MEPNATEAPCTLATVFISRDSLLSVGMHPLVASPRRALSWETDFVIVAKQRCVLSALCP